MFGNGTGVVATSNAVIYIDRSEITGNTTGVAVGGGTVVTYANNAINGNGADVNGTLTQVAAK